MTSRGRPSKRKKSPPGLYLRGGIWWTRVHGIRESTKLPELEIVTAKEILAQRLREYAQRAAGIKPEPALPRLTLGELIDAYLASESNTYDREKGGEQEGTKRSADTDRQSKTVLLRHLDGEMLASELTTEKIITLAEAISRAPKAPSRVTRRKHLSFLRRVYNWAAERPTKSGITDTPFRRLTRAQRRDLFPKSGKRGYVLSPEQLRGIYLLAKWRRPLIQFAVHSGMRYGELTSLTWACVNLPRRFVVVEDRFAKNGTEREVPLGDVAAGVLTELKPEKADPKALVFTNPAGEPIESVRTWWDRAVSKVWEPSKPSERRPRFHDLRKTAGTRVESVSSHAVAKLLLGHADGDVTDSYVIPTADDVRAALNRAARLIDGTKAGNVVVAEFSRDGRAQNQHSDLGNGVIGA